MEEECWWDSGAFPVDIECCCLSTMGLSKLQKRKTSAPLFCIVTFLG